MNPAAFAPIAAVAITWMLYKAIQLAHKEDTQREQERLDRLTGGQDG